jgi:hypothetical protein
MDTLLHFCGRRRKKKRVEKEMKEKEWRREEGSC